MIMVVAMMMMMITMIMVVMMMILVMMIDDASTHHIITYGMMYADLLHLLFDHLPVAVLRIQSCLYPRECR